MSREFSATIRMVVDIDELEEVFDRTFTDEEAAEYVRELMVEDLGTATDSEVAEWILVEKVTA